MITRRRLGLSAAGLALASVARAAEPAEIGPARQPSGAPLIVGGKPVQVLADPGDWPGVLRAIEDLRLDLAKVAGAAGSPLPSHRQDGPAIIVGTIGRSGLIDALAAAGKLDLSGVTGVWEAFVQQVVERPVPGVERALVIAGADKRGTIFGVYDLCRRMGVSPWTWWADVPVTVKPDLSVGPGRRVQKPGVTYRGIFLNDEDPALLTWANATFGGFNHAFYEKLFPLILRLKGNYLWPAMWGKSLWDDDPLSAALADDYGVVLGTSHHEPMVRSHVEWERYGQGLWDYTKNAERLQAFWRAGLERMGRHETLVTVGMRGDGDEPMTQGTATALLERIVADQRRIIGEVTGKDPKEIPQVWALYKEVQDYYDQGMRVPDDVTLLFSDDNWGNIRRLPELGAKRPGGYGVYYHFDYVGGPRNYKWINTNQVSRTWEQMRLAWDYGADRLWIVNVGDLKPMELPTSFFLDYAWDPDAWPLERLAGYTREWAAEQFGPAHAAEIADLLEGYTQANARRKPELLAPDTFSLVDEREAERVLAEWDDLEGRAERLASLILPAAKDAYVQLVQWPIQASANLTRLYVAAGRNRLYAEQGRASANAWGEEVRRLFARDAELTRQFHQELSGGKWVGMMSQTHIGYTTWQQPPQNVMPEVATLAMRAPMGPGLAVEGDPRSWRGAGAALPVLDRDGPASRWIDLFHSGRPFRFTIRADQPWIAVNPVSGEVGEDQRLEVLVDWGRAPPGDSRATLRIETDAGQTLAVEVPVSNPRRRRSGYVEAAGRLAVEAPHYARASGGWRVIPGLGRSLGGVGFYPTTAPASQPGQGPFLEYAVDLAAPGEVEVFVACAPTLDFRGKGGLRFAVSLDEAAAQVLQLPIDRDQKAWEKAVADNAVVVSATLNAARAGAHRLRLWRVDPGVVFERIVIARGKLPATYLGPRESLRR